MARLKLRDEPPLWIGLGLLGAAGAFALTFGDTLWSDWPPEAHDFVGRGASILWLTVVFVQVAIWAGLQRPAWVLAGKVSAGENWKTSVPGLVALVALIGLVVYIGSTLELDYPLPGHDPKLAFLTVVGSLAIVPSVLALWRVHRLSSALKRGVGGKDWKGDLARAVRREPRTHPVESLQDLRSVLDQTLILLGVMLTAAVFAVAAFRNAVVAWYPPVPEGQASPFDPVYVLFYGGALTLLLAVLYVPALLSVRALCDKALDTLIPIDREDPEWEDKLEQRSNVAKELKLDVALGAGLSSVWILTPLLTSAAGVLLPD
jgi:hypothetical protein